MNRAHFSDTLILPFSSISPFSFPCPAESEVIKGYVSCSEGGIVLRTSWRSSGAHICPCGLFQEPYMGQVDADRNPEARHKGNKPLLPLFPEEKEPQDTTKYLPAEVAPSLRSWRNGSCPSSQQERRSDSFKERDNVRHLWSQNIQPFLIDPYPRVQSQGKGLCIEML